MRQRRDLAEHRMVALDRITRRILIALGQRRTSEAIGQRRLANALRPNQQPSVVHAVAMQCIVELADCRVMAEQLIDLARRREAVEPVRLVK